MLLHAARQNRHYDSPSRIQIIAFRNSIKGARGSELTARRRERSRRRRCGRRWRCPTGRATSPCSPRGAAAAAPRCSRCRSTRAPPGGSRRPCAPPTCNEKKKTEQTAAAESRDPIESNPTEAAAGVSWVGGSCGVPGLGGACLLAAGGEDVEALLRLRGHRGIERRRRRRRSG